MARIKIISIVLMLCFLGILTSCGEDKTSSSQPKIEENSPLPSTSSTEIINTAPYQSYTVDENGIIFDTKTGSIVDDSNLSIDDKGNIILKRNGHIVVTATRVEENRKLLFSESVEPTESVSQTETDAINLGEDSFSGKETNSAQSNDNTLNSDTTTGQENSSEDRCTESFSTPVNGEKEWLFYSLDPSNYDPRWGKGDWGYDISGSLVIYKIKVNDDLSARITFEHYIPLAQYPYDNYEADKIQTVNGIDYIWQMTSYYDGGCFPICDGTVEIELRCYDDHGNFLNDLLTFRRVEEDTITLISNDGKALNLYPGNTFTR